MNFIEFIQDAIANDKKVLVKSLSDTIKVLTDGENEFQLRLPVHPSMKQKEIDKLKNQKLVIYKVFTGVNDTDTGYEVYKLKGRNYYYVVTDDVKGKLIFTVFKFVIEENRVIFSNQPPDDNETKTIYKKLKTDKIIATIFLLLMPIALGALIYLILAVLSTLNCF